MAFLKNPAWIENRWFSYSSADGIPVSTFDEINRNLRSLYCGEPVASIVIPAWNEEVNIVRTLYSLSKNVTSYPVEIIVVNNNSTDKTQEILNCLNVKSYLQTKQGCGPARQLGQEMATGKYILMADADCFYPKGWIQKMVTELKKEGVSGVYGRYSFIATANKPRWKLFLYETLRDIISELRHFKRPYLNSLGMSMGYVKELGLKAGFVNRKVRGEDGRMCFQLMQFGTIRQMRSRANRVWTMPRTLDKEGSLFLSLLSRAVLELSRIKDYFYKQAPHDTNSSENYTPSSINYFKRYKAVHKETEENINV